VVAALALALLTAINCLGVRAGSTVQTVLMLLKIAAIASLILCGLFVPDRPEPAIGSTNTGPLLDGPLSVDLLTAFGAAMVPVLFAYGGWQTANFIAAEIREPRKNLPRGLVIGVIGVIALYLAVNFVCVRALGTAGLAQTSDSRVRRDETGTRSIWCAVNRGGNRYFYAGIFESGNADRAARVFRDGSGSSVFQGRGVASSQNASAGYSDRTAGSDGHHHSPVGPIRSDPELRGVGRFHILRAQRDLYIHVSKTRPER
jgi:amino acid transporter